MCERMFVQNSNVKGAVAEQALVLAAMKLHVPVLRPVGEHGRCDLAFDIGDRIWRVQAKWGRLSKARDVVIVDLRTSRCTPNGYVRTKYTEHEIDLFGVYCGELDQCFLIPVGIVATTNYTHLRLTPARNGQRACINLAEDFEFEGAVAQLARARDWQSRGRGFESPQLHSAESSPTIVGCDSFRDHFGYWLDEAAKGEHLLVTRHGHPLARLIPPADQLRLAA
jgi:prevent-host-death family protein